MDLSKLSTPDLEALRDGDLSRVSTDGLLYLKQAATPAPVAQKEPSMIDRVGRQFALTARHGLEGVGQLLDLGGAPIAATLNKAFPSQRFDLPSTSMKKVADSIGLPDPGNENERIAGEAAKFMAGTGGIVGIAGKAAKLPGVAGDVMKSLAAQPASQITGAAGSGAASQYAKETNQGPFWQYAAGLGGSLAGAAVPNIASSVSNKVSSLLPSAQKQLDVRLTNILADSGVDFKALPNPVKQSLRSQVSKAMNLGDLNPDAVRRLADFTTVGATPTKGMLTLDPVQITREQNLAKIAANMQDDELRGLPLLQNQNNKALINFANKTAGGDADLYAAGERTVGAINARDAAAKAVENRLYKRAQESAGRDVELSRSDFTNKAFENLAKVNKGAFLPDSVERLINEISVGKTAKLGKEFDVPFNVDTIDMLKTTLAAESRATANGNAKAAIKAVRDALEQTPIQPIKRKFGGNQVVTEGGAGYLTAQDQMPEAALKAFDKARAFARARRAWQESSPGVNAAIDGAAPDKFIEQFVLKGPVSTAEGVVRELRRSPEALEATRQSIVNHLKAKALGNADDEVGKFSQKSYNDALKAIGDRKLSLLFNEQELGQLKALGRAASYMQVQPVGSAVNNSNSGALVLGKFGDGLEALLKATPFAEGLANLTKGARLAISTGKVKDIPGGLLMPQEEVPFFSRGLLPAAVFSGGLLSAPVSD